MKTLTYLNEEGNLSSAFHSPLPEEILLHGLKTMMLTRAVDERMITLQRQGMISFALSSLGEEGCIVASAAALTSEDWLYPQYREVGALFWRGYSIQSYLHHMFGNVKDSLLGRQMPNHFGSREFNVVTCSSPLGTKIPHTAGCAYAMKLLKQPTVALCYFGEGTSSKGDFHAGLNFAAVKSVPAIFFCRNNGYAISTPVRSQFVSDGVAPKGDAYGIAAYRVDGNDFFAVYETTFKARQQCLEGKGPVLIEAMTYRRGAHSTSDDPSLYRDASEVAEWEKRDPILRLRLYLERKGVWNNQQEKAFNQQVKEEIDKAIEVAKETPLPPLETLIKDVYFEIPVSLKEQWNDLVEDI